MDILAGIYLLEEGLRDFRTKEISPWVGFIVALLGFLYSLSIDRSWISIVLAEIPGMICLVISICTRQSIGYGDGILLCCLGMLYSLEDLLFICMIGILFAGIVGLILLIIFQKSGKYEIPFVPFLFMGWFILQGMELAGGGVT